LFLQNLWKKFNDIVAPFFKNTDFKKIEEFVNESYTDILKAVGIVGGVLIAFALLIVFIFTLNSKPAEKKKESATTVNDGKIKADVSVLLADEYMYPQVESFEINGEYENFMNIKKYKIPDFNSINYDIMIDDCINESCKFDFEKRR
jgi:hypothetical protein